MHCDYIVNCEEVFDWDGRIYVILEYMNGGSLSSIIKDTFQLSEAFCKYSIYCVVLGLQHMHNKQVLHRDIKSDNILVRPDGTVKICDLGLSAFNKDKEHKRLTQTGTPHWTAPEILQGHPYTNKVDVYSLGCTAYELATGNPPFKNYKLQELQAILEETPAEIDLTKFSENYWHFIQFCMQKNPTDRPDVTQLLN